jgi:hypothetical protein
MDWPQCLRGRCLTGVHQILQVGIQRGVLLFEKSIPKAIERDDKNRRLPGVSGWRPEDIYGNHRDGQQYHHTNGGGDPSAEGIPK